VAQEAERTVAVDRMRVVQKLWLVEGALLGIEAKEARQGVEWEHPVWGSHLTARFFFAVHALPLP